MFRVAGQRISPVYLSDVRLRLSNTEDSSKEVFEGRVALTALGDDRLTSADRAAKRLAERRIGMQMVVGGTELVVEGALDIICFKPVFTTDKREFTVRAEVLSQAVGDVLIRPANEFD